MNPEAMREFEAELRTNENLLQTFKAQKVAHQIVLGDELLKLKAQMTKDLGGPHSGNSLGKTWGYILSGTLIVAVGIIIYLMNSETATPIKVPDKTEARDSISKQKTPLPGSQKEISDTVKNDAEVIPDKKENTIIPEIEVPEKEEALSDRVIHFSCQARGTCLQGHEGAIEIDINTIKTGKAPFMYSISPDSNFTKEPVISDLKAGKYNLYVKDSKQKVRKLNVKVEVPVINCNHIIK
jgi:hypothetical protein